MFPQHPIYNNTAPKATEAAPNYDVVVIGGGIQGAGIVQAAQAAGYRSLIIEKNDWASGTSSKSSKLIHGGLRYLKSKEFGLVRESLSERTLLSKLAPSLVKNNTFYIPVYKDSAHRPWQIKMALYLYWALSGFSNKNHFKTVPQYQWGELFGLNASNLQQVFSYNDAQTDDVELTKAVIRSAESLSADTLCPAELASAEKTDGGYRLTISMADGNTKVVDCRFVVNATGPWINQVVERFEPTPKHMNIDLVQGSHLVLNQQISEECFYLEHPDDKRPVFVLAWKDKTLLGTTETLFTGDPDHVSTTEEEREYLLKVLAHYFPNYAGEVCEEMAGLRVLPAANKQFYARSREVKLIKDTHYLAVYGGKLTGYRATAEKVMLYIDESIGSRTTSANTKKIKLDSDDTAVEQPV